MLSVQRYSYYTCQKNGTQAVMQLEELIFELSM